MSLTPEAPFPPACAARFRPGRLLARGGFGAVWQATQVGLERQVAVKILLDDVLEDPELVERFLAEARITAALQHPHVVTLIDHGVDGGVPWIALEYLPGRNLRDILSSGQLSQTRALSVLTQVADALAYSHARDVLHRDVKPENVIEVEDGRFKVTDFGIAKWRREGAVKTKTGVILGTPAYLAPEVIAGEPVTPAADVYALGVLAYELLTGRLPFDDANLMVVLERHLKTPPPPMTGVAPALQEVVLRALAKRPADRTPSAAQFAAELARPARPARNSTRLVVRAAPRPRWPLAAGAAVLVVAAALVPRGGPPPPPPSATAAPSVAAPVGPLGAQVFVFPGEHELSVRVNTLEPVRLQVEVLGAKGAPHLRQDPAPLRRHAWTVKGLEPGTDYTCRVTDADGRRVPAHAKVDARTRPAGSREATRSFVRGLFHAEYRGVLPPQDLQLTALDTLLERVDTSLDQLDRAHWRLLFDKLGETRSTAATPIVLKLSNRAPADVPQAMAWAALARLADPAAFAPLRAVLLAPPARLEPADPDLLGSALFWSDQVRAGELAVQWRKHLPHPTSFQIATLASVVRHSRRPELAHVLEELLAEANDGYAFTWLAASAAMLGGPAAARTTEATLTKAVAAGTLIGAGHALQWRAEVGGPDAARALAPYLDGHPWLAEQALRALARLGDRAHLGRMREFLEHPSLDMRQAAAWALGELRDEGAVADLTAALTPFGHTRGQAPRALAAIGTAAARQALLAHAASPAAAAVLDGRTTDLPAAVELGDTLHAIARLRLPGARPLLERAFSAPHLYVAGRAIEGAGWLGDRALEPVLQRLAVPRLLTRLHQEACRWLTSGPPAGLPVTLEMRGVRPTGLKLALGDALALHTCGLLVGPKGAVAAIVGPNVRDISWTPVVTPRVGAELMSDVRADPSHTTRLDAGELVLHGGEGGGEGGGFVTVWVAKR